MPKLPKKSVEEQEAEDYFVPEEKNVITTEKKVVEIIPTPSDLLKKSTEKKVISRAPKEEIIKNSVSKKYSRPSRNEIETIESTPAKIGKKKITKKGKKTKRGKTTTKEIKYIAPKITLKKGGYELIITEKPQAAAKIATALGDATQRMENKVSYYEVDRNGQKIIVACAVGHLFTLKQNVPGTIVPIFDVSWVPNYLAIKKDFTKRYYDTILGLAKNAGKLTVATDYDHEGEVIGWNVVRFICNQPDAQRMKFSTLTKDELNSAYEHKSPHLDWGQATAGETRHYLDWFYGINLSRALMNAIKTTGKFKIMSIGRVQGPTLKLIVEKEKEIEAFISEPYWQVFIKVKDKKHKLDLKYIKDIFDKTELKNFEGLVGKKAIAETKKTTTIVPPNSPFNLTELQKEAYKFYGITPARTLQIAQSLYLAGLISYPRTSSQKLPESIGYKEILKVIAKKFKAESLIKREKPIEGEKSDPAHPSIYPTGNFGVLAEQDEKVYNLIAKRFLALFCEDAVMDKKKVTAKINNLSFTADGSQIKTKGWMAIYPTKTKEVEIPDMEGEVEILEKWDEEKETQPPKRYSPASIITELEKRNLGTKATRAAIVETLYDRGYVKGTSSIEATHLGMSLIKTLDKYSPIIIDDNLTKDLQDETDAIVEAKGDFKEKEDKILDKAKDTIVKIAKDFEKNQDKIGKELMNAENTARTEQKKENELIKCPNCEKGMLAMTYSPKTRNFFVACNAYPECKTTYSLPPNGTIKKTDKICEYCKFPMLMRLNKGKRPWIFCFNKNCESNKQRMEDYKKKLEEEKNG